MIGFEERVTKCFVERIDGIEPNPSTLEPFEPF